MGFYPSREISSQHQIRCLMPLFLAESRRSEFNHIDKDDEITAIRDKHLRVLLIDDDALLRVAMSFMLTAKYGAEVKDVGSGMEAIETLQAGDLFDIIFLDIMMPQMNGIETYQQLRKIDDECKVVMMSAHSESDEWKEGEALNVEMLPKPIPERRVIEVLGNIGN